MTTESTDELLVQGLEELYYTEQKLLDALDELADQTDHEEVSRGFAEHREETEQHVERLEKVFEEIGEEPQRREERVVDALIQEHEEFAGENDGEVLDRYNISTGQKTEHYEIAMYGNVTSLAGKLGHDDAADMLEETLREEEEALDELSEAGEQFDQQQIAGD